MADFVARTNRFYPPDAITRSLAEQRAVYDRMAAAFRAPRPEGVAVRDSVVPAIPPVPVRIYEGTGGGTTLVYFHGGGFVVGGLDSHDDVCAEICARAGVRVVAVDYRLCPEHLHPAAFDDALAATRWVLAEYAEPVVLAGDSAGGTLTAAISHALRGADRQPAGQVLIYPALGGDRSLPSYTVHAHAPMLTTAEVDYYTDIRTGGVPVAGDPTLEPLHDADFAGLPPTVAVPAEFDPLCSDAAAYCDAVRKAGGRAVCLVQNGWLHGGLRARHSADVAARAFDRIVQAVGVLGRGDWIW
ncbi:MAG: alpha/beta hydrolase [Rhodobiaceae bacterium]|nr:alpha/beta hydrolase [Rhodobiaceae bacterium]